MYHQGGNVKSTRVTDDNKWLKCDYNNTLESEKEAEIMFEIISYIISHFRSSRAETAQIRFLYFINTRVLCVVCTRRQPARARVRCLRRLRRKSVLSGQGEEQEMRYIILNEVKWNKTKSQRRANKCCYNSMKGARLSPINTFSFSHLRVAELYAWIASAARRVCSRIPAWAISSRWRIMTSPDFSSLSAIWCWCHKGSLK